MEIVGMLAGALTLVIFVPQTVKTIQTRKTRDLSLVTYLLLLSSALLWVIYGLGKDLPSIWIANLVVATLALVVLVIKLQNKEWC